MQHETQHEFALYYQDLSRNYSNTEITINNEQLIHRLVRVLRFNSKDKWIFFDHSHHAQASLLGIEKKRIYVALGELRQNIPLLPSISAYIPILKKEALENALFLVTQMGVQEIHLTITKNAHRSSIDEKELQRLSTFIKTACEQAKQFCVPSLFTPKSIYTLFEKQTPHLFICDPYGTPLITNLTQTSFERTIPINLIIGPETGLAQSEIDYLKDTGGILSSLTPTILRAPEAISLAVGITRCFFQATSDKHG